jgi:pimeloyl-ACP methyl ester carboxylesterase
MSPTDFPVHRFAAPDGVHLAWREVGEGRPLVLFHGLFSNAWTNWIRYGHAARIAAAGVRLILPDLRGHGDSDAPHDKSHWPPDILAADGEALVAHLGLTDYDLGGYSLGGRTTARMLARGARPARAIFAGMGLQGMVHTAGRGGFFRKVLEGIGTHKQGSAEWLAEAFLKTTGGDPQALLPLLDTFVDTPLEILSSLELPILVLTGEQDNDNGSAEALADILPHGIFRSVPGNHMSAVLKPELGAAIADFLGD